MCPFVCSCWPFGLLSFNKVDCASVGDAVQGGQSVEKLGRVRKVQRN